MKILIAVDSFKGSLASKQAADIIKNGMISVCKDLEIFTIPIADGGEGTVESFVENVGGEYITVNVNDPLFRPIKAQYGIIENGKTAIIEMAAASGLNLIKKDERNPLLTSSYGTGEMILDAAKQEVKNILIGIGGSATNDGGVGMASALGIKFLNKYGKEIGVDGASLNDLESIDNTRRSKLLSDINITVLCDVTNPLLGTDGASFVYGPQKGGTEDRITVLEKNLNNLVHVVKKDLKKNLQDIPGAGAAGGLGYGLMVFLDAKLKSGIQVLVDSLSLEEKIKAVDLIITGEGKLDSQTSFNKAPWGIMQLAKKHNKKVIGVAGIIEDEDNNLKGNFDYLYPIVNSKVTIDQSMNNPQKYLYNLSKRIANDLF